MYRTRELARWSANPTRLAARLVRDGALVALGHGLYACPTPSFFGPKLPDDAAVMRAFLGSDEFVFSGPPTWTPLGLGATAAWSSTLVYNRKRTGEFHFAGRTYLLRRVDFPADPSPEWRVIDLLRHHEQAGVDVETVAQRLRTSVENGRFDVAALLVCASTFAEVSIRTVLEQALGVWIG
ncbi:MAG: hypothetical protein H6747_13800 [Deltaproteobacteria bacterium]|nr:hypothetical protein [Deltaproteobacteria bacterium]